jgi:transposase
MGGEESVAPEDAARNEQIKTVLRAVEPWDEDSGMTYREAAKLVDYSRGWVSDRVQDWRDGQYRDLVDAEVPQTA